MNEDVIRTMATTKGFAAKEAVRDVRRGPG
jgi:hypothetical protein